MARGLNGGWRRSVVRSRVARGGQGEIAPRSVVAINTSPPRLAFTTTYLSRRVAREQNLTLSLRHEPEGGIVEPENADHLGLGRVRALTPSPLPLARIALLVEEKSVVLWKTRKCHTVCASIYRSIKINLRMSYFSKQQFYIKYIIFRI